MFLPYVERVSSSSSSSPWSRWHRVGAALAIVFSLAATFGTIALIDLGTHEIAHTDDDDVEATASGRPFVRSFSVGTTVQQLAPLVGTATSGRCLVSTAGTPVHIVNPNGVTPGEGPFCADCIGGASFAFPSSSVYVVTTTGTATVGCSFFDGTQPASTSGGAGGMSQAAADTRFLKLDASNTPLTGGAMSVDKSTNTLASPTYTSATGRDLVIAPSLGITGRGLFFSTSLAASATDAVMLTGTSASGSGRTSLAFIGPVTAVADRYVARFASSVADVLRIAGNGALLPGATTDAGDLGATGNAWANLFLGTSITGESNGKALGVTDVDGVSVTSAGKGITVQPSGSVAFNLESSTTWTSNLRLPGSVYSGGGVSAPPCASGPFPGRVVYVDRIGDGIRALVCICAADAADVYAYRRLDDLATSCDVVP